MNSMEDYFYDGQFLKCFEEARRQLHGEHGEQAVKFLGIFEKYDYGLFPHPTMAVVQSLERADESYAEYDEVEQLRAVNDEQQFTARVKQLEHDARSADDARKAQSFYVQGHLFLLAHHYDESVHCLKEAVKHSPNKALFYGMTGQTMHRLGWAPFEAMPYIERAIELDAKNARWYWNKALILTQLYKDLQVESFLGSALMAVEKAAEVCREDQNSLRLGIDAALENLKEYVLH